MAGFDAKNRNILDPKFICPVCLLILKDPVQLNTCGHRLCQSCFNNETRTTTTCPVCQTEIQRTKILLDRGFKNEMQSLPINCTLCEWSDTLKNYQDHLDQFHAHPKCEYCDKLCNSINQLNQHKIFECQKVTTDCALKEFGCSEPIMRGKMEEHYLTQQHQGTVIKIVRQMQAQLIDSQMDIDPSRITTTSAGDPAAAHVMELYETLNILTGGIQALNDDGQRLSNESLQNQVKLQALTEETSKIKISMEESQGFLQGVKHNQDILSQDLTSLKEKLDDMQYVSYDGTLVWKITNFQEKMTDAQSERQTSIYSPPFHSSPTGYKMRARLYLYGDGNARRTHMSLFFILMRSLHDPILKFPFNYKVAFCLYDQSGQEKHIIDSFRPDIRSNSFQRPRSEMNIASGIPKFFRLPVIQQEGNSYVRNDTMFIKVMVDFNNIPEPVLPFALGINPGLPMHMQQQRIDEEVRRKEEEPLKAMAEFSALIFDREDMDY